MFTVRDSEPVLTQEDGVPCVKTCREILPAIIHDKDLDELIKSAVRGDDGHVTIELGQLEPVVFHDREWAENPEVRRNLLAEHLDLFGIKVEERPCGVPLKVEKPAKHSHPTAKKDEDDEPVDTHKKEIKSPKK